MQQGNVAAPSRVVDDPEIRRRFEHEGHRTAVSRRALQAHADPWLGWCELDGRVVKELSACEADLDWDSVTERDEMKPLLRFLGQATVKIHCVWGAGSDQSPVSCQVEDAVADLAGEDPDGFADDLARFGARYGAMVRTDHHLFVDAFRNGEIPGASCEVTLPPARGTVRLQRRPACRLTRRG